MMALFEQVSTIDEEIRALRLAVRAPDELSIPTTKNVRQFGVTGGADVAGVSLRVGAKTPA